MAVVVCFLPLPRCLLAHFIRCHDEQGSTAQECDLTKTEPEEHSTAPEEK